MLPGAWCLTAMWGAAMSIDAPPAGSAFVEWAVRLLAFALVMAAMALWEYRSPRRPLTIGRSVRWPANLGVLLIDTLLVRVLFPSAALGFALVCQARGWGVFNIAPVPIAVAVALSILLLDLAIYLQHALFHAVPVLWRLHRMHHADLDVDVTTGVRFHPGEIVLSLLIKFGAIGLLGAPALAVLIFEVLLNATSMFNHSNIAMPPAVDRVVRRLVVTPDMHRVHHSVLPAETNSNYGFNFPWWDRLFGTYRAQPAEGHAGMRIGVEGFRNPAELRLDRMLLQPLRGAGRTGTDNG
jgi:sterol desaturase/sphingolipid hydroxylase (fatty acid hydroxylase superfamily)